MADQWYCEIAGREIGPLSPEQLRAMAAKGQILPNDCVRQGEQGSWVLARQVKGLLSPAPELPRPKPPAFQAPSPENLPVAQRLPQTPAVPPSAPPQPPVVPPSAMDNSDAFPFILETDPPVVGAASPASTANLLRAKRRLERQKIMVGWLLAAVVGLAITGLMLAVGGSPPRIKIFSTELKRIDDASQKAREAESPDALEAREGIDSLEPAKSK